MEQATFSELDHDLKKRRTRREIFLEKMDRLVPWERLEKRIEPFYPKAGRGRRPYPLRTTSRQLGTHAFPVLQRVGHLARRASGQPRRRRADFPRRFERSSKDTARPVRDDAQIATGNWGHTRFPSYSA